MATDPLGSTVHDDVCAVLDRVDDIAAGTEGVVDNQGDAMVMRDLHEIILNQEVRGREERKDLSYLGEGGDVVEYVLGIRDALDVDSLGAVVDGGGECFGSDLCDPFHTNAKVLEGDLELVVGLGSDDHCQYDVHRQGGSGVALTPPYR